MKNPLVAILVVAVFLIGGSVIYSKNISSSYNEGINTEVKNIKGNENGSVTLVEYGDFECPACATMHPFLFEVMEKYGDDIRLEFKHFPLQQIHPRAMLGAKAAEAAGQQGKFFEFHDILFERQNEWVKSPNPRVVLSNYAEELELDIKQFKKQIDASLLTDRIKQDQKEGVELGVNSTPTFFLNGEKMEISSYEDFEEQIAKAVNPNFEFPDLEVLNQDNDKTEE